MKLIGVDLGIPQEAREVGYVDSDAGVLVVTGCTATPQSSGSGPLITAACGVECVEADNAFNTWDLSLPHRDALTTPTVTAAAGSGLVASASLRHTLSNGFCDVTGEVSIPTRGSSTGPMLLSLPFTAKYRTQFSAREVATTGLDCEGSVEAGSSVLNLTRFDNDFVGGDGSMVVFSGRFRVGT